MFEAMIEAIEDDVVKYMYRVNVVSQPMMTMDDPLENATMNNPTVDTTDGEAVKEPVVNKGPEIGRNDPCPCGSGKKYKNCCGKGK
jgi:preprotein translocase subunit SecA